MGRPFVLKIRGRHEELLGQLKRVEKEVGRLGKRIDRGRFLEPNDRRFVEAAGQVIATKRTLLRQDRLWMLWQGARNAASLELPAAEIGSYRGGSAFFLATAFAEALGRELPFEVIDTFGGLTYGDFSAQDWPEGRPPEVLDAAAQSFADTSRDDVAMYLSPFELVTVHAGDIADVAPRLPHERYGFVHVDVDLYEPAVACLEYFGPKLAIGGVLVLDDYEAPKCPGIRRAAEEFLTGRSGFQAWNPHTEQLILTRHS